MIQSGVSSWAQRLWNGQGGAEGEVFCLSPFQIVKYYLFSEPRLPTAAQGIVLAEQEQVGGAAQTRSSCGSVWEALAPGELPVLG